MNPWDRRADEPRAAYRAFLAFRDLGPTRTLGAAGEAIGREYYTVANYSKTHAWFDRARAWDEQLQATEDAATLSEVQRLAKKQMRVWEDLLDKAGREAIALLDQDDGEVDVREIVLMADKATEKLRLIVGEATSREEQRHSIDVAKLSPEARAALRLVLDEAGIDEL